MNFKTAQEEFWAGDFGHEYMQRNEGEALVSANVALFCRILRASTGIGSIAEFGCNIGLNLQALHRINKGFSLTGYEINRAAAATARSSTRAEIHEGTIIEKLPADRTFDLTFTKGVLIHIHPDKLPNVYENLCALSRRYVMVCEYYNPTPVPVTYRGVEDRLFKRDFAGELIERHGLRLVDYGFVYHRDPTFPQGDLTWFLLEK